MGTTTGKGRKVDTKRIQSARGSSLYTAEIFSRPLAIVTIQNDAGKYCGVVLDGRAMIIAHTFGHETEQEALGEVVRQLCNVQPAAPA